MGDFLGRIREAWLRDTFVSNSAALNSAWISAFQPRGCDGKYVRSTRRDLRATGADIYCARVVSTGDSWSGFRRLRRQSGFYLSEVW